jgi:predicted esterase YcpF (UPF0227 family)
MSQVKSLYYFNGFNAAILEDFSGNPKIAAVAEFASEKGYRFIPVSTCYRRAGEHCKEVLAGISEGTDEVVFCGSSMGGWFARILQLHLNLEKPGVPSVAVAFNPAYDLCVHGHLLLGEQVNFVTGEKYTWTEQHGAELCRLEAAVDYDLPVPFYVYIDKGDEVIGWESSAARHSHVARLTMYEGGCHSFDHFREALADFGAECTK